MIRQVKTNYEGYDCWEVANEVLSLWLSLDFGPRILGISYLDGENLLAVLPESKIPVESGLDYSLRGGHRLWVAPEKPEITYLPDDLPPRVREIEGGLEVVQEVDGPTGIQKSWRVQMDEDRSRVVIDHRLDNRGNGPFNLAPWAVTMLRPGGVGLLPLQTEPDDPHGLWPNRQLVFWPYTDLNSRHLKITNTGVYVEADLSEGALKIGAPNPFGWLAYRQNNQVFVKETHYQEGGKYPDRGASHQIYCNPDVIELETLGPLITLEPGAFVEHKEIWSIYSPDGLPDQIQELYNQNPT